MPLARGVADAIAAGFDYEAEFAKSIGAELQMQPGSGNQWWAKLDIGGSTAMFSLKSTANDRYPIDRDEIYEAVAAVSGPGGVGGDIKPMMGLRISSLSRPEDLIVCRHADFIDIVRQETKFVKPTRAEERERRGRTRSLDR